MGKKSSTGSFVLGALLGAGLGLLFAPRSGEETREFLADKVLEYWDNADELYGNATDRAVELYSTSRDVALDATEQVRQKIDAARAALGADVASGVEDVADATAPAAAAAADVANKAADAAKKAVAPAAAKTKKKAAKA